MSELTDKLKNNRNTILAIIVIVAVVFLIVPNLRSIVQPEPPVQGTGYAKVIFRDSLNNITVNAKFDLVKVNDTDEFYARGVTTNTLIHLTESCYVVWNGTLVGTYPHNYHYMSGSIEANEEVSDPKINTFIVKVIATSANVDLQITKMNTTYGNFDCADISNQVDTTLQFVSQNNNLSRFIGSSVWLPDMISNTTAVSLNATGYSTNIAFIGSTNPVTEDWCYLFGQNVSVYKIGKVTIIQNIGSDNEGINFNIKIKTLGSVSKVVLYYGEITDWYKTNNILEVIV